MDEVPSDSWTYEKESQLAFVYWKGEKIKIGKYRTSEEAAAAARRFIERKKAEG